MVTGMQRPTFDVLGFLHEPGHAASVATTTARGNPALAMMWFLVEDGRFWFHSPGERTRPVPFLQAARAGRDVAVMVATFNPPDDVRQVRTVGPARLEERDVCLIRRLYQRYVPTWSPLWTSQVASTKFRLWSMTPDRGMAVTFPDLRDQPEFRWTTAASLFGL